MRGVEIDLSAVNDGSRESGVAYGTELLTYTDAVMARETAGIAKARETIDRELGPDGVVDTAAVIAMFNVFDRVADATGIPIDEGFSRDMRYAIGTELGMGHLSPEERSGR